MKYIVSGIVAVIAITCYLGKWLLGEKFVACLPYTICGFILLGALLWFTQITSVVVIKLVKSVTSIAAYREIAWNEVYDTLLWMYPKVKWGLMNHGYAKDSTIGYTIEMEEAEEFERYSYQLYHHVGTGMREFSNFKQLDILEVACGRGGGLAFLTKHLHPASAVGIDSNSGHIAFCKRTYRDIADLRFLVGSADNLPCPDRSVDIVIDIGNSHCYRDFRQYLSEVARVLKLNGRFFFADFRHKSEIPRLDEDLRGRRLQPDKKEDISESVVHALEFDSLRRMKLIETCTMRRKRYSALIAAMKEFAGVEGSAFFSKLKRGDLRYMAYKMTKVE